MPIANSRGKPNFSAQLNGTQAFLKAALHSASLFSLYTPGFLKIGDPGDMALSVRERLTHATFQMGACALGVGLVGRMGEGARGD